jgi:hypothetical protein
MISENSKNTPPPGVTTAIAPPQQPIRRSCYSNSPYPDATLVRLCYRQPRPPPAKPGLRLRLHGLPTQLHHRPPHTRPGPCRTRTCHNRHCSIPCPHHAAGTPCSLSTAGTIQRVARDHKMQTAHNSPPNKSTTSSRKAEERPQPPGECEPTSRPSTKANATSTNFAAPTPTETSTRHLHHCPQQLCSATTSTRTSRSQ